MTRYCRYTAFAAALLLSLAFTWPARGQDAAATEANITRLTAGILGGSQFAHQPLDDSLVSAFLERYLDALDGDHTLFLATDVSQVASLGASLAGQTRNAGDTRIAHAIFARYLLRLEQRVAHVTGMLHEATFDFTAQDSYSLDRSQAPRPHDLAQARQLWEQRLRFDYLQEKLNGKSAEQIVTTLTGRANRTLQAMKQMSRDAVLEIYLSALAQVYDPHSDYLGHEQMQEFAIQMNLSLFGIGASLRSEDGHCRIVELLPGGPAARSGVLKPGDRIVAVAQDGGEPVDVIDMPLARIVALIRGPKGTVVNLTVLPSGAADDAVRRSLALVRDEIKLEERRAKAKIIDIPQDRGPALRIGVVELPAFYSGLGEDRARGSGDAAQPISATADVAALLGKLKSEQVQGVILDLRRNGGGSLEEAISLTGLFIDQGPVVQTRGLRGDIEVGTDTDPSVLYGGPLLVLTSRLSASASEIVAGALQDYGRAIIVGDPSTYGKGTVQSVVRLAPIMDRSGLAYSHDPGALTVTIRKFYRPSGASTQLKGVAPDIVIPSPSDRSDVGESVLDNPLPWDTVPAAGYRRVDMVAPHVADLRERSARRVADGEQFKYLREEIARLKRRLATKTVSLNEAERRQEIADFERRKEEHAKAMLALADPVPVSYEITVQHAAMPGLPPPEAPPKAVEPAAKAGQQEAEGEGPQRDVILGEAQTILIDYLSLLAPGRVGRTTQARSAIRAPVN